MKRTLYYFTASYPWGMGETWKRNELRRLVPHFERIVVVPYSYAGNTTAPKKLPDGVTATPPLFNTGDPRGDHALLRAPTPRLVATIGRELLEHRPHTRHHVKALAASAIQLDRLMDHPTVRQVLRDRNADTSLCFFWGRGSCDFLTQTGPSGWGASVVRMHRFDLFEDQNAGYIPLRRRLVSSCGVLAPSSEAGVRHLRSRYPDAKARVRKIRIGAEPFAPVAASTDGVLRIVSCSFVTPVKRVHLIAEALKGFTRRVHWTHVGAGPLLDDLKTAVASLPSNVEVDLPGMVPTEKLSEFYAARKIDLFLNVSSSEGIPMSIMESLSASIPVYATDVGGVSEIVDSSVGRLLPAALTGAALLDALNSFADESDSSRRQTRQAAQGRFQADWDADVVIKELLQEL